MNEEEKDPEKPRRILYVDHGRDLAWMDKIAEHLRSLGEVDVMHGLSDQTVEKVREAAQSRPYDAVVSHLPPTRGVRCSGWSRMAQVTGKYAEYGAAFGLLGRIRALGEMPIYAYSGAGRSNIPAFAEDASGINGVIDKTNDPEADGRELAGSIKYEWQKLNEKPEPLRIERSPDGSSLQMEVKLLQRNGLNATLCAKVAKQFGRLSGSITAVETNGTAAEEVSLNDMMGMMTLCAYPGCRLRIRLEEVMPETEEALRDMHELFSRKY